MTRYALLVVGFIAAVGLLTFASVRFGLGRLPGDIIVDRGGFVLYLPITTSILASLLVSLVLWLLNR
ncbi:DUF2905 domain-containing protein [Methyloceanibacter sp.]|uniref:DUF2905 domain-containing protein n=1 Tax=Methyloceanibacter sp. TaxID=1965321 RepID=UPI003D6CD8BB